MAKRYVPGGDTGRSGRWIGHPLLAEVGAATAVGVGVDHIALGVEPANLLIFSLGKCEAELDVVVVVAGETGREAFADSTGLDPMAFAKQAMDRTGEIDNRLAGGVCPDAGDADTEAPNNHHVEFGFAFAEAENGDVGGLYAEGDVIHAYAHCSCGTDFTQKWVADQ